eukprot:3706323-Prymnesium_polylepis.1
MPRDAGAAPRWRAAAACRRVAQPKRRAAVAHRRCASEAEGRSCRRAGGRALAAAGGAGGGDKVVERLAPLGKLEQVGDAAQDERRRARDVGGLRARARCVGV